MELRICDFRNAKFQGQTINKQPNGFGIAIDQNYNLTMGKWENNKLSGPFITFFEDSSKLYGFADANQKKNFEVFMDNQIKIYKKDNNIVLDYFKINVLFKLQEYQDRQKNRDGTTIQKKYRIRQQAKYTNEEFKKSLSSFMKLQEEELSSSFNYQTFIKENFKLKYKDLLNVSQTSKQFTVSFRHEGFFIKLSKNPDMVYSLGFNGLEKKPEIGRRYTLIQGKGILLTEQFIKIQPQFHSQFEIKLKGKKSLNDVINKEIDRTGNQKKRIIDGLDCQLKIRQKQCVKQLRQYYMRSLTFNNKYLNLQNTYLSKEYFDKLLSSISDIEVGKMGQIKLQNNGYILDENGNPIIVSGKADTNEATLEDWRKEIDRAKNRGNIARRRESNYENSKYIEKSTDYKNSPQRTNFTPIKTPIAKKNFDENISMTYERSKSKKRIKYMDSDIEERIQSKKALTDQINIRTPVKSYPVIQTKFKYTSQEEIKNRQVSPYSYSKKKYVY